MDEETKLPKVTLWFVPIGTKVRLTKNLQTMIDYFTKRDQWFVEPVASQQDYLTFHDYRHQPIVKIFHKLVKYEDLLAKPDDLELQIDSAEFDKTLQPIIKSLVTDDVDPEIIFRDETRGSSYLMIVPQAKVQQIEIGNDQLEKIANGEELELVVHKFTKGNEQHYENIRISAESEVIQRYLREHELVWSDLVQLQTSLTTDKKTENEKHFEELIKIMKTLGVSMPKLPEMPEIKEFEQQEHIYKEFQEIWTGSPWESRYAGTTSDPSKPTTWGGTTDASTTSWSEWTDVKFTKESFDK